MGCDDFHPKVHLDLAKETRGEVVKFLEKVEQCGKWPQQASTTMFFLIPKNVTSERPIALMPTLIRWWEAMGGGEVGRGIGLIGTLLMAEMEELSELCVKLLVEMERFKHRAGEGDQGAVALVLDLAKALERVNLPVVWAWATHFSFPRKILRMLCGYFEHQRRVQFEECVAEPPQTITAILPGSKWSCLLLSIVLQDAWSEVTKITLF